MIPALRRWAVDHEDDLDLAYDVALWLLVLTTLLYGAFLVILHFDYQLREHLIGFLEAEEAREA